VTAVELGDLDRGYSAIDITGKDQRLYSLTCPLMLGVFVVTIPKVTKGKLALVAKNKTGQPLATRLEALELPRENSGYLLAPPAKVDRNSVATGTGKHAVNEIKEWQAIMDYIRGLPVENKGGLPTIPVDERAFGGSGIQNGLIGFGADGPQPQAGTFGANLKRFARARYVRRRRNRPVPAHRTQCVPTLLSARSTPHACRAVGREPLIARPCFLYVVACHAPSHLQPGGPSLLSLF
jgi:hypothetical protein